MPAIDQLRAADTLLFAAVSFTLNIPTMPPTPGSVGPLCVRKAAGSLAFTLTSADLGIPIPGLTFPFTGTPDATGTSVTWRVDLPVDIWFGGVHLSRVQGQIVTTVSDIPPSLARACDGTERLVRVALATTGGSNMLTISIDLIGAATVTNITAAGSAGEAVPALFFRVGIRTSDLQSDGCGSGVLLTGTTVRFHALIEDLRTIGAPGGETYAWTISGPGTAAGPADQPTLSVRLTGTGTLTVNVAVTVRTSVQSGSQQARAVYGVLTPDELELRRLWCRFRARTVVRQPLVKLARGAGAGFTVGGIRFVDPLWDPTPDDLRVSEQIVTRAYTLDELKQMRDTAERMVKDASAVANQTALLIDQRAKLDAAVSQAAGPQIKKEVPGQGQPPLKPGQGEPPFKKG